MSSAISRKSCSWACDVGCIVCVFDLCLPEHHVPVHIESTLCSKRDVLTRLRQDIGIEGPPHDALLLIRGLNHKRPRVHDGAMAIGWVRPVIDLRLVRSGW